MTKMYVWRCGLIEIGEEVPYGAIEVGEGTVQEVNEWLVYARLAKDGNQHLVPGLPEAENIEDAIEALRRLKEIIYNKMDDQPAFQDIGTSKSPDTKKKKPHD